jgi:N-acetylglutamate synthase-like GNAT family acetyltransferase
MDEEERSKRLITRSGFLFDVRPAHLGDEAKLSALFLHVTDEDKAFRSLTGHAEEISFTDMGHQANKIFLALVDDEAEVIAAGALDCESDLKRGEVNLVIRSDFKHDGVSWELLTHIVHYAESMGVKMLESVEALDNQAAIALERDMGFTPANHPTNPALILMRKKLGPT